ncbi:hypothetical protein MBLNU459_g5089t2 [Dothideomycetes sp. NU459]
MANRSAAPFARYFPKAAGPTTRLDPGSLPVRPSTVGPVFDDARSRSPIEPFDEAVHRDNWRDTTAEADGSVPSDAPDAFSDAYLYPSLTRNERLRLTMLWYYARDVMEDKEFLLRLQEKLDLVQTFMGWEFAIVGLISENVFTRLVTAGLPLAILPRRESTCSHTITQPSGTVLMLPNMHTDWRFKHSPHVEVGGITSYAGTQLRCRADDGQEVNLGSLCIASNTEQPPLPPAEQAALVRFADMITGEIVNRSRENRKRQRHRMSELINSIQVQAEPENAESLILAAIRSVYPNAHVSLQQTFDGVVRLSDHSTVPLADFENGLWEDAEAIDAIIQSNNHEELCTTHAVRAIVFPSNLYPTTQCLVLTSNEMQLVFDDVDAWFIERCALILRNTMQEGRLKDALKVKENFLRGITHQLRTPIHGVLGSCELLAEELASLNLLGPPASPNMNGTAKQSGMVSASSVLKTIRDSGRELMTTVNNILKLNRWAETGGEPQPATLETLDQVEADILNEVLQTLPEHELSQISILFENQLANDDSMIVIDWVLLKECVQALILNSLQFTEEGCIIITISGSLEYSRLRFDVIDTGIGIHLADQKRIFEAYEKVDSHTRGVGLGLTLASKIATVMNGTVTLVRSETSGKRRGSHFRADFHDPGFACSLRRKQPLRPRLPDMPQSFHVIPAETERPDLVLHFARYLKHRGFQDSQSPDNSMIIVTYTPDAEAFRKLLESVDPRQAAMCLVPAGANTDKIHGKHEVRLFSGPFLTTRLEEILTELDQVYHRLNSDHALGETASGFASTTENHRTDEVSSKVSPADAVPIALLVDDNIVNLRIMRMYCEKRQIAYATAADGREAVEQYQASIEKNEPINLVLMDLQMPVCDGLQATREIRALEKKSALQPLAIFMVTGQDSVQDKLHSLEAGADEFYVKPMSIKTLDRGIGQYFPGFAPKKGSKR